MAYHHGVLLRTLLLCASIALVWPLPVTGSRPGETRRVDIAYADPR